MSETITDLQVCQAYWVWRQRGEPRKGWVYDVLRERTGQRLWRCVRAMHRACDRGLVEYGVSIRTGWLTPKGESLVRDAQAAALQELVDQAQELDMGY